MRGAEVPGKALEIDLGRILPAEGIQFPTRCPPGCGFLGIFVAKLRCQVKGIGRSQGVKASRGVTSMQGLLHFSEPLRGQSAGENIHHLSRSS